MPFPDPSVDYYAVLGVDRLATVDEIREAARRKSKEWHPDRRPWDADADAQMSLINDARSVLEDGSLRDRYDRNRAQYGVHRVGLYAPGPGPGVVVEFVPTAAHTANMPSRIGHDQSYGEVSVPWTDAAVMVEERSSPPHPTTTGGEGVAPQPGPQPRRERYRRPRRLGVLLLIAASMLAIVSSTLATRRSGYPSRDPATASSSPAVHTTSSAIVSANAPRPVIADEQVEIEPGFSADVVSCNTDAVCIAIDPQSAASYRFANGSWAGPVPIPIAVGPQTRGLSCPSPNYCVLLTSLSAVVTYDGSSWTVVATGLSGARALACSSARMCVVVGANGPVLAFDGNAWTAAGPPPPGDGTPVDLVAVSCPADSACVAVDEHGLTYADVNRQWRLEAPLARVSGVVDSLACVTASSCIAVAGGALWRFDGTSWSSLTPAYGGGRDLFVSTSCASNGACAAVGARGGLLTITGAGVTEPQVVDAYGLRSVSCGTSTLCAAVDGASGLVTFSLSP